MENTENNFTEQPSAPKAKWFQNAWFSRGTLVIAGLFFLLPFININCSGNKLASIKGIDMVFGSSLKPEVPKAEAKVEEKVSESLTPATDSTALGADSLSASLNSLGDSLTTSLNSLTDSLGGALNKVFKDE